VKLSPGLFVGRRFNASILLSFRALAKVEEKPDLLKEKNREAKLKGKGSVQLTSWH
jgi:hypothetical protein